MSFNGTGSTGLCLSCQPDSHCGSCASNVVRCCPVPVWASDLRLTMQAVDLIGHGTVDLEPLALVGASLIKAASQCRSMAHPTTSDQCPLEFVNSFIMRQHFLASAVNRTLTQAHDSVSGHSHNLLSTGCFQHPRLRQGVRSTNG
jgi:hypothetical protein